MSDVVGIQAVRAVLNQSPNRARCLYIGRGRRDARVSELIALAKDAGVRFRSVEPQFFQRRIEQDVAHQQVLLECHEIETADEGALLAHVDTLACPFLLILDGITDPRNLGACLRTAHAAGVDAVVLPTNKSAPLSTVALKTAQGGAEGLFIAEVTNLSRTLKALQQRGVWLVGAAGESAANYTSVDLNVATGIVMGAEAKGLRRLTRDHCDHLVSIPMAGSVSSLNVAVATGVLLFEVVRQRALAD
ncbi:MAG: 23S rRNA (guanosine(2251)-2'-O)-methyltransferase RlmB [Pseudomonadota bacterium]